MITKLPVPRYVFFTLLFVVRSRLLVNADCSAGHFDLAELAKWNPWVSVANISGNPTKFFFTFCASGEICPGSSVCWQKNVSVAVNVGSENSDLSNPELNQYGSGFRLDFIGAPCEVEGKSWSTSIDFKCGTTLGSPEFLSNNTCTFAFEWHTTVACKVDSIKATSEVPCYVYDEYNRKRDLTPLIKQTGGYLVDSDGDRDFYINVCRDITVGTIQSCPINSSGCQVKDGVGVNDGTAATRLEIIEQDKLRLRYNTDIVPANCNGYKPSTKITFICPRESGRFGGSKDPVLLSDTNCHYIIEWQTEYACEVDMYTSNGDCKFTYDNDGVDIDLGPLRDSTQVFFADEEGQNRYYIAVCGSLDSCGDSSDVAVCQHKYPEYQESHSAGKSTAYNLRYTDGEVMLTYSEGETCQHNGFQRTSVISFKCNKTAGLGSPKFISEVHCMYFFEWETQHVCLEHSRDTSCRVSHGAQRYDLSSLVKEGGYNWVALDGRHKHDQSEDGGVYYINICANILPSDERTTDCPPGSSICFIDHSNVAHNLGQFKGSPTYDDGEIILTYVDGEEKGDCTANTTIRFVCTPGDMESAPSLVRSLEHSCEYEFEWRTAAACPLGRRMGENCQVFDEDAGFTFDLSPLTKSEGYHNITVGGYDYLLNVCDELHDTPCNNEPSQHPGACQVEQEGGQNHFNLGMTNSTLEYYDGILKLSYMMGDKYRPVNGEAAHRQADLIFLCDLRTHGDGRIEFTSEANNTYTFQWYTMYACPQPPVECIVTDATTHHQYDLSSLSKALDEDNWSYVDSHDVTSKHKYYINVCRPVNPLPLCFPFAAACQTTFHGEREVAGIKNLGLAVSPPTVESEGNLLLTYTEGADCENGHIQTKLHLRCAKGELASSPRLLGVLEDGCTYSFLWETEAACPISTSEGTDCAVTDQNSGYTFNLASLTLPDLFYEPTKKTSDLPTTRINICKKASGCPPISGEAAGACVNDGDHWQALGSANSNLVYSDDGLLTLTYEGEFIPEADRNRKVVITFICRHDISSSTKKPETVSCDGTKECHFNFETPLACLPEPVDCLVSDSAGNQYDLTSLAKDDGNWEAVDTREDKGHQSYHINVCKPLNSLGPEVADCPGGPIAACQTDSKTGHSFNLGYVQAMPEAADDGTLSIRYVGGDPCNGNPSVQKSTRINFECSDTPGSPVFQAETDYCEYVFSWQTPAACPVKRIRGQDCQVSVKELGFKFDLSALHNVSHDYEVTTADYRYRINVCGPLVGSTADCPEGVGGCQEQLTGTKGFNAGVANSGLMYDSGILKLNYTDGLPCHNAVYKRSTAINFVCDDTLADNGHPKFIRETGDCTYLFEWATPLACPPFQQVECSYRDDNLQFDLAPLGTTGDNYEVSSKEEAGMFYLGVCRSLRNTPGKKGASCPVNAAACLEVPGTDGEPSSFINLGQVSTGPTMEGGHLVLRYTSGDPCPSGVEGRSTVINFDCDHQSMNSLPEFQYSEDDCTYHFLWMDKLACGITHKDVTGNDCSVANPLTGFEFDLTVLQGIQSVNINGFDQHVYNISICKPLEDTLCEGSEIGGCQAQRDTPNPKHFITGIVNKNVFFDDGVLSLQYKQGTPCHNKQFHRSTVISFVCPHEEESLGEPVFVSESQDCTYYFSWHTSAACEQYVQCSLVNGSETIDLSSLVQKRGYYVADAATSSVHVAGTIYINLCRPLNPIQGTPCPPNAAVCHVPSNGEPKSLGRIESGPQLDGHGQVFVEYIRGSPCQEDPSKNVSSMIRFVCKRGEEKGVPNLIDYDNCRYVFEWSTYVVCPPAAASSGKDCTYRDDVMEYVFDLSSLSHQSYKMNPSAGKEVSLQLCGTVPSDGGSGCDGAAVCLKDGQSKLSLGKASAQEFVFEGGNLKVTYSDGSTCPNDEHNNRETTIIFKCIDSRESEDPTFFVADANFCHTTLQWKTPIACPPQTMPCTVARHDGEYDLQALSQITGSWIAEDSDKEKYFINICKPALSTPTQCPNEATICRRQPSGAVETLGMIYTQKLEYKEDDRLLLTYTEGVVNTCGGPETVSREGYDARVEIEFTCSSVIGKPVLKSKTLEVGVCIFSFTWSSKVACKVEKDPVLLTHGKVTDPVTKEELDLSPLLEGGSEGGTWIVKGDDRGQSNNALDQYQYYILLKDDTTMELPGSSEDCNDAAVCQTKTDGRFFRNIGDMSDKTYFMEDGTLEMIARNPSSCRKDNSDVFSTIIFECDPEQTPGNPEFLYESGNCQYFFVWQTSHVCQSISQDGSSSEQHTDAKKGSFGKVFLVLLVVVTLCVLVIVFHKRERRSAVYVRIRRCFPGAYSNVPTYSYVQLSTGDNMDGTTDETRGLFDSDAEDEEIIRETRPNPLEYKDDSDEDLLVDSGV